MPISNTDRRYNLLKDQWRRNRDAYRGQSAIHNGGILYLPALGDMDLKTKEGSELYETFKNRTLFFNATGSTVDGLTGLVFRKDPINKLTDNISYLKSSVNMTNKSLKEFEMDAVRELMITDIVGIHTTMPDTFYDGMSVAEAERLNIKPYLTMYKAEDILKVFYTSVNNVQRIQMVVLREFVEQENGSEFEREIFEQYRVLDLVYEEGNYVFRERLYDDSETLIYETYPTIQGEYFDYIPFEIVSATSMGKAVVEDLVNANINHYQYNASYSWGVYQLGFPTPIATGISEDEIPNSVGPGTFWYSESSSAKFDVLSGAPEGTRAGKEYLEKVEGYMAALGAEMLSANKMAAETAESKRLDKQAQYSSLSIIAQVVSSAIERSLKIAAAWVGDNPDDVSIELNRDYYPTSMNAQMLTSLLSALQSGSISYATFYENLQKGEIASTNRDSAQEKELIEADDNQGF